MLIGKIAVNNNELRKNAILNMVKQGCAIFFPFITFSYASRILGVDQIGSFSFAQSIVSYFSLIAALGIKEYSVREGMLVREKKEELNAFVNEIFSINIIFTAIAYLLLGVLLLVNKDVSQYRQMIILYAFSILLTTLGVEWVNLVYEDFGYITIRHITIGILGLLLLFTFVKKANDIYKYILIVMFSSYGGNIMNLFYIRKRLKIRFTYLLNLRKHMKPLFILFFNSIAIVIYLNSDITLIGILLNDVYTGRYYAASKIYTMIKVLINALIMAAVPRASRILAKGSNKEYNNMVLHILEGILMITIPVSFGVALKSEKIIYLILGEKYIGGSSSLRILGLALPFAVSAYLLSSVVLIPNHLEEKFMHAAVIGAGVNIILNFIFIPHYGILGAATTTLIAECIVCVLCCHYSKNMLKGYPDMRLILCILIGSVTVYGVCKLTDLLIKQFLFNLFLSIFASAIFYGGIMCFYWKKGRKRSLR